MNESPEPRPTKRRWRIYSVLMAIIFVCSIPWDLWLFRAPTPPTQTPKPDGKQTYEEFAAAVMSYPYEASQARKDRIVKNYPKLAVGMSKDRVAELIGDPDYSGLGYGPKGPNEKWRGSDWTYWFRKRDNGINSFDPVVQIFFGTDDRAHWIVPSNIDGLKEKDSFASE
jgi:hypothetical protein